jgi:hypothetical protein
MIRRIRPAPNPRGKPAPPSTAVRTARGGISILDAIRDDRLFWPWFSKRPASWAAWLTFLCALFALEMSPEQLRLYQKCTGRKKPPHGVARYAYLICGRRAGKSFMLALVATFLACFFNYAPYLARGERGTVMIVASDRRQARTILRYKFPQMIFL